MIYDEIDKVIIDIYMDYDIKTFPIDEKEVCKKMGVVLKPYSGFSWNGRVLLRKKSQQGFFIRESKECPPTIYFNDRQQSEGAKRFTIFHELKHYVFEDIDDEKDDLADYFARHFMCPTVYLMLKGIDTPESIISFCGTSREAAENACSAINKRRKKYGMKLFPYEVELVRHLEPTLLDTASIV